MFDPWVGKIPWRREKLPTPVFWPREFHGLYIVHGVTNSQTRLIDFHSLTPEADFRMRVGKQVVYLAYNLRKQS